ncbi:Mediator of RNA polymerase II transcription subunit 16 [Trachymyrmex zeteki]|uniref:Mediator of RNA polymerase II transcription subunit 16 n=1 Tax=Mycetomoellerius zeteki TaxID=64791 RepID=A0A151WVN7_9HYME|nr:Mediator of RNA polymerase II transcription subunit 16 [Trachymyrmex zeteki]
MTELDDSSGKTRGCHVYVADLNMPWHAHKVLSNKHNITALEWDLPGDKLVMADTAGNVQLWMFKDHILNEWVLIGSAYFPGEHILGAAWFHNGKKTGLVTEKKDSIHYSEKFNHLLFAPSVRQFGGRAAEGVLVVSTTGMVGAIMITKDLQNPTCYSTESLGNTRHRITAVDLCYGKNGHFLVAVSSGSICLPIRCFRVLVRKNDDKCTITSQALPSFFLQDGAPKDNSCTVVTHLKFVVREDADSLVIAANSESGGFVEVWELREKSQPVHKLFQPKTLEPFKTVVWQYQSQYRCQSPVTAIATTKLSIVTTLPPPSYVIIALADSSVHCLNRLDCLKEVAFSSLNTSWRPDEPSNKYFKNSVSIAHMDLSWLGCVLLACDTQGNMYLYKLLPDGTTGTSMSLSYACTLLEYCLVTGLDWLDILLCLRSSMIEALCERLDVSFNRQLQSTQQYHYIQFLSIKTSLYRMLITGQNKAADLSSLLMIHSVATAFKSLLRPSDLISHDKGPAESLAAVITDVITDVDKVLLHLDPKEFTVEPSTLQSLQQLIQWVADLALNLLARLPEQRMQMKTGGYELLKDHKALNTVRELLVIIRIWGLLRPSCLPVFLRSADNLDVLALLFCLLSKLVQPNGDTQQQVDDGLIGKSEIHRIHEDIMTTKLAIKHKDSLVLKENKLHEKNYTIQQSRLKRYEHLSLPWSTLSVFVVYWLVLCPLIWAICYKFAYWPSYWSFLFWTVAFLIWIVIMCGLIIFWRRFQVKQSLEINTISKYGSDKERRPRSVHQISSEDSEFLRTKKWNDSHESESKSDRENLRRDLPPLVIHKQISGENIEDTDGVVCVEENEKTRLSVASDYVQKSPLQDYLKLVTVSPSEDEVKSPKTPMSPRDLFFIDLIREAEKVERSLKTRTHFFPSETTENDSAETVKSITNGTDIEDVEHRKDVKDTEDENVKDKKDNKLRSKRESNECCLLPNQIMIPQLHQGNSITAIVSPILFYQNLPLQLEYGVEPEQLVFTPEMNPVEGCMHSGQIVDTIRHLYLGRQPLLVKQCTRCGGKAQVQNMTRTAAIRAWDQRWTRACRCGGIWRIHKASQ